MAAPALCVAPALPLSRFATTTLVAAMSNPLPPPKAKPSRAASASGATSIITSAGALRERAAQVLPGDGEDLVHGS